MKKIIPSKAKLLKDKVIKCYNEFFDCEDYSCPFYKYCENGTIKDMPNYCMELIQYRQKRVKK